MYKESRLEYFLPPTSTVKIPLRSNEEAHNQARALWRRIEYVVTDVRERRVAYFLFHCDLSPKEIVQRCAHEFPDVQEVYVLRCALMKQLVDIL